MGHVLLPQPIPSVGSAGDTAQSMLITETQGFPS